VETPEHRLRKYVLHDVRGIDLIPSQLKSLVSRLLKKGRVLREPQHERKFSNDFNPSSVRPELCRRMNGIFQHPARRYGAGFAPIDSTLLEPIPYHRRGLRSKCGIQLDRDGPMIIGNNAMTCL
jgi:hypothetical protein